VFPETEIGGIAIESLILEHEIAEQKSTNRLKNNIFSSSRLCVFARVSS
jgi:hypothetical protein